MMIIRLLLFFTLLAALPGPAVADDDLDTVRISFKTLACDGTEGFAYVNADRIVRIEQSACREGDPVAGLYLLLVTAESGGGFRYDAFTTTKEEAERIIKRADQWQEDKAKSVRDGYRILLH